MDKYAQLKRFHRDHQLQVYMYGFMYVDPDTIPVEANFLDTKTYVVNHKKMSTPGKFPKHWLVFSHTRSEDYELDNKYDETYLKRQPDNTSSDKVFFFARILWSFKGCHRTR